MCVCVKTDSHFQKPRLKTQDQCKYDPAVCVLSAYPVVKGKVDSLCKVEPLVESGVVGSREGHHELTRTLVSAHHLGGG